VARRQGSCRSRSLITLPPAHGLAGSGVNDDGSFVGKLAVGLQGRSVAAVVQSDWPLAAADVAAAAGAAVARGAWWRSTTVDPCRSRHAAATSNNGRRRRQLLCHHRRPDRYPPSACFMMCGGPFACRTCSEDQREARRRAARAPSATAKIRVKPSKRSLIQGRSGYSSCKLLHPDRHQVERDQRAEHVEATRPVPGSAPGRPRRRQAAGRTRRHRTTTHRAASSSTMPRTKSQRPPPRSGRPTGGE
jgi:hypothetical protein